MFQHILALKAVGLEVSHVTYDFLLSRIVLLRLRPMLSWLYTDHTDPTRTVRRHDSEL